MDSVTVDIQFDLSEGFCGAPHPDRPDITCAFPVVGGEGYHLMMGNIHMGYIPPGVHVSWPRT